MANLSVKTDVPYALLRIIAGCMFAFHGVQKVFGIYASKSTALFTQIWIGGVIELVGGVLIALGLFTRIAALLASGTMAVAYVQFHWKWQLDRNFWPSLNKGELAALYSFVFLYFAAYGPGRFALDARRG